MVVVSSLGGLCVLCDSVVRVFIAKVVTVADTITLQVARYRPEQEAAPTFQEYTERIEKTPKAFRAHFIAVHRDQYVGLCMLLPKDLAFASGVTFADALSGSADTNGSPMLLVPPCGPLPSSLTAYLASVHTANASSPGLPEGGLLFGGTRAVGDDVLRQIEAAVAAPG